MRKMLSVPINGQFEQLMNARWLHTVEIAKRAEEESCTVSVA